ncbi:hypothetical protein PR048_007116 [Dryococelus australis]|uniref:Uncharacterized protein n=1 Tax=Dryococelus australis TaxID=614101 RepID=A0ABQ9ICR5_9NEOP|nr:hypothetical protein PR048_007116 [Dryococelus australis]
MEPYRQISDVVLRKILAQLAQPNVEIRPSCSWPKFPSNPAFPVLGGRDSLPLLHLSLSDITLASHQSEPGSVPGRVTGFSLVGLVPDDAVGRRVFSGISRFPHPLILGTAPYSLQSPSPALKTSLIRAAQLSSLHIKYDVGAEVNDRFNEHGADVALSAHLAQQHHCKTLRVRGQEARERYGRQLHARLVPRRSYEQGVQCFRRDALVGAAVAERLARSPPTKANRVQSPACGNCVRTVPLAGWFSRGSPAGDAPYSPQSPSSVPKTSLSRAAQSLHSFKYNCSYNLVAKLGVPIAVRLLASHQDEPGPIPGPGLTGFSHAGIVPDDAVGRRVFLGHLQFPPTPSSRHCSIVTSITLIGSQDLAVTSRPNLFTHSLTKGPEHPLSRAAKSSADYLLRIQIRSRSGSADHSSRPTAAKNVTKSNHIKDIHGLRQGRSLFNTDQYYGWKPGERGLCRRGTAPARRSEMGACHPPRYVWSSTFGIIIKCSFYREQPLHGFNPQDATEIVGGRRTSGRVSGRGKRTVSGFASATAQSLQAIAQEEAPTRKDVSSLQPRADWHIAFRKTRTASRPANAIAFSIKATELSPLS